MNEQNLVPHLRRGWRTIALATLLGGTIAAALMLFAVPSYVAQSELYVPPTQVGFNRGLEASSRAASYADLVKSDLVLQPIAEESENPTAELARLRETVDVEHRQGSALITVQTRASTAAAAQRTGEEILSQLRATISDVEGIPEAIADRHVVAASDPVATAQSLIWPRVLGTLAGLLVGAITGFALIRTKVRHDAEIRSAPELRRLGHVVLADLSKDADTGVADFLGALRFSEAAHPLRSIHLCGVASDATAAYAAGQLALGASARGSRVLLIDAGLGHSRLAGVLGIEQPAKGLSDVLLGEAALDEVLLTRGTLSLLAPGQPVPNPDQILSGSKWDELLVNVAVRFDLVLVAQEGHGKFWGDNRNQVVLVARPERDSTPALVAAERTLVQNHATMAGAVLARDPRLLPPLVWPEPTAATSPDDVVNDEVEPTQVREVGLF